MGVFIALQLAFPALNLGLEWTTFGRLRPLHTSAVIFAFGGNALIGTSLYVVQRTCRAPPVRRPGARAGSCSGATSSSSCWPPPATARRHPEPRIRRARVVRRPLADGRLGRLSRRSSSARCCARREPHIYVANWFYLAFIVTIAMLHVVNNLAVPVSFFGTKSYSLFAGVQDALTQWWYGHNAVGFFLTAGFLGMMYYFIPKQAEPAGLFLPAVDRPLLVADLPLHLGGPAPPALHGAARLGADARHGLLDHAVDAVLGRHDQRPDDAVGRLGQAAHRPGAALPRGRRSRSTA